MAATLLGSSYTAGNGGHNVTYTGGETAIVVLFCSVPPGITNTLSVSDGTNTYTAISALANENSYNGQSGMQIFKADAVTAGTYHISGIRTQTVPVNYENAAGIGCWRYSGLAAGAVLGSSVRVQDNPGTTNGLISGTAITPTAQPALLFAVENEQNSPASGTIRPESGFNERGPVNFINNGGDALDLRITSLSAVTPAFRSDNGYVASSIAAVLIAESSGISPFWLNADISYVGWTSTAATLAEAIDESTADDADYITSPIITSSTAPYIGSLNTPLIAGTYNFSIRGARRSVPAYLKVSFLNNAGILQGTTSFITLSTTLTTYALSVTLTGTATRIQIEVYSSTDNTAPVLNTATVENSNSSIVVLTFNENLAGTLAAASAFAVSGSTITSLAAGITPNIIELTLSAPIVYGDVKTVSYTKPGTNKLQDSAANEVANFSAISITNNVEVPVVITYPQINSPLGLSMIEGGNGISGWSYSSSTAVSCYAPAATGRTAAQLLANTNGYIAGILGSFIVSSDNNCRIELASPTTDKDYQSAPYGLLVSLNEYRVAGEYGGSAADVTGVVPVTGDIIRIRRTGSTIVGEKSSNGGSTFTTLKTWSSASTAALAGYVGVSQYGSINFLTSSGMSELAARSDNFNRANGTLGVPSDGGSAWLGIGSSYSNATIVANQVPYVSDGYAGGMLVSSTADCIVSANMILTGTVYTGIIARIKNNDNYGVFFGYTSYDGEFRIQKNVSGTQTNITSAYVTTLSNGTYRLSVELTGNVIVCKCNDAVIFTVYGEDMISETKHGFFTYGDGVIDNFNVDPLTASTRSDTFNRANSSTIGTPSDNKSAWIPAWDAFDVGISGNAARASADYSPSALVTECANPNGTISGVFILPNSTSYNFGLVARSTNLSAAVDDINNAQRNAIIFQLYRYYGSNYWTLDHRYRDTNASNISTSTSNLPSYTPGNLTLSMELIGPRIICKSENNVIFDVENPGVSLNANTNHGFLLAPDHPTNKPTIDSWNFTSGIGTLNTFTDNFNRANQTGLGNNWKKLFEDGWDIVGNKAQITISNFYMYQARGMNSDGTLEADINANASIVFRLRSSRDQLQIGFSGTAVTVYRLIDDGGTGTATIGTYSITASVVTVKVEYVKNWVTVSVNGVPRIFLTESFMLKQPNIGLLSHNSGATVDNLTATPRLISNSAYDTFAGSTGASTANSRIATGGNTWTRVGAADFGINLNRAYTSVAYGDGIASMLTIDTGFTNRTSTWIIIPGSNHKWGGLIRYTDANNYSFWQIKQDYVSNYEIHVYEMVSGSLTELDYSGSASGYVGYPPGSTGVSISATVIGTACVIRRGTRPVINTTLTVSTGSKSGLYVRPYETTGTDGYWCEISHVPV